MDKWISWNHGYALDEYQIHKINTAADGDHRIPVTELAFEAVKSSLNYLTVFPNNGKFNLRKSFGGNNVFVNLPAGFGQSFIFRCLPIVANIVHSKPKHAYMYN